MNADGSASSKPTVEADAAKQSVTTGDKAGKEPDAITTTDINKVVGATQKVSEALDNTVLKAAEIGFKEANAVAPAPIYESSGKAIGKASKVLGVASLGLTGLDAMTNGKGWQTKHTIEATVGVLTFVPAIGEVVGPVCFFANLATMAANDGKGISDTIQDSIDKK